MIYSENQRQQIIRDLGLIQDRIVNAREGALYSNEPLIAREEVLSIKLIANNPELVRMIKKLRPDVIDSKLYIRKNDIVLSVDLFMPVVSYTVD